MKSVASFDFVSAIRIGKPVLYSSIGVSPQMDGDLWTGLSVEIHHADDASPTEIVAAAREALRDVLTLVGVGRGLEPVLGTAHVRSAAATASEPTTGLPQQKAKAFIVRHLLEMPSENLVFRLDVDPRLRRQAEALNAARADSDVVSRIRWSYMVMEQEQARRLGYDPLDEYRHLRNGVSHPELTEPAARAYFQKALGVDFPDLKNPSHLEFLAAQAPKLLDEAVRIVEESFRGDEFWQ